MKITIESTSAILALNDIPCRVWQGTTENGIAIFALIPRVAVKRDADAAEFHRDLLEQAEPTPETREFLATIPLRLVI